MDEVECVVIGAGVIGLASAAAVARAGREVIVIEAEAAIGTHTSSRNSEVIHAGLYYAPGSLKAKLCRRGKKQLYDYAKQRHIPYRKTGKLIVAQTDKQVLKLEEIQANAAANGVCDLELLTKDEVKAIEPAVRCKSALFSPSTGIIDSHSLMLALQVDLETAGGMVVLRTAFRSAEIVNDGIIVETAGVDAMRLKTRYLVNCAGLWAPTVARTIVGVDKTTIPKEYYAIGHYYRLSGRSPCSMPIYPIPKSGGLGVHLTVDLGNQAKFGPDVRWIDKIDYAFDDSRFEEMLDAVKSYLPGLNPDRLAPDYTGIRPKIVGPGVDAADFRIDTQAQHGGKGVTNLFGIESPGLTASLAIGDLVAGSI